MTLAVKVAEFWYLLKARLAMLAGRRGRARNALKAAVRRNPNGFMAHFLLGRIYWRDRAAVKAKREFDLAWQIDPERFERAYARLRTQQDSVPELFAYPAGNGEVQISVQRRVPRTAYIGDFKNEAERRRFDALPPITRDEIRRIDWDRFQEQIIRDRDAD